MEQLTRTTRWAIIAAVIIAIGAGGTVAAIIVGGAEEPDPTPPSRTSPTSASSSCGLKDGPSAGLASPPEAEWKLVGKLAAPFSKTAGPAKTTRGVHHCFAHSTEGALLAAAFTAIDGSTAADPVKALQLHYLEESPGYRAALDEAQAQAGGSESTGAQIAGFRVDSSLADASTITLALRSTGSASAGELVAFTLALKWDDKAGDWRTVMPQGGPQANSLESLDGFVEWSGT